MMANKAYFQNYLNIERARIYERCFQLEFALVSSK